MRIPLTFLPPDCGYRFYKPLAITLALSAAPTWAAPALPDAQPITGDHALPPPFFSTKY